MIHGFYGVFSKPLFDGGFYKTLFPRIETWENFREEILDLDKGNVTAFNLNHDYRDHGDCPGTHPWAVKHFFIPPTHLGEIYAAINAAAREKEGFLTPGGRVESTWKARVPRLSAEENELFCFKDLEVFYRDCVKHHHG